jgi:RecA/RadA recombinase
MDKRLLELLNNLGFTEHPEILQLYLKYIDEDTNAYVDFRKDHNGNEKGRRFAKRGRDFIDDPDEIEALRQYKAERDRIPGLTKENEPKKQDVSNFRDQGLFDLIKSIVGYDVLEIFGDTGAGKSKFVHALALSAINSGRKVFFLDTERNLNEKDISMLNGAYRYTPVFDEIKKIIQKLPEVDLVIIDSVGLPVLTKFARMSLKEKGKALLDLIALMGDLKEWAYRHRGIAVVINQPESEFAKPEGYERKPFGDKSSFAAKEIWHMEALKKDKSLTTSQVKAFRSRSMGKGTCILSVEISSEGTKIVSQP